MSDWDWSIPGITAPNSASTGAPEAPAVPDIIKNAVNTMVSGAKDIVSSVSGVTSAASGAAAKVGAAAQAAAGAKDQIDNIEAGAAAKLKADNAQTAAKLGTEPGDASTLIAHYVQQSQPIRDEMYSTQNELMRMNRTTLFNDPIQFLMDSFTRTSVEHREATLEHFLSANASDVSNVQAISQSAVRDNAISDTVDATKELAARSIINKSQADVQAADALDKALGMTMSGISIRSAQNMDIMMGAVHEQQAAITQVEEIQHAKMLDINETLKGLQIEARDFALKEKEQQEAVITKGAANLGLQGVNIDTIKMMSPVQKDAIIMAGVNTIPGAVSITTARSIDTYVRAGLEPNAPGQARTLMYAEKWLNPLLTTQGATLKQMAPDARFAAEDAAIQAKAAEELKLIPHNPDSMYAPSPLGRVLGLPGLIDLPIAKEIAPLSKDPLQPTDPSAFLAIAKNMIKPTDGSKPKATMEDMASQISTIFQAAAADNNDVRKYNSLNLQSLKIGNLPMSVPGRNGRGSEALNMGDPAAIKNYLMRSMLVDQMKTNKTFNARPGGFQ